MKIAEIVYGIAGGGAPNVALTLLDNLLKFGHDVHLIRINIPYNNDKEKKIMSDLNNRGIKNFILNRKTKRLGILNIFKLIKTINREEYDIVHSHLLFPDIYAAISSLLCIHKFTHFITVHNTKPYHKKCMLQTIFRKSIFVRCSPAIQPINSNISNHVIPNGINLDKFKPNDSFSGFIRQEISLPKNSYLIVSVGNLRKQKNHSTAINMMAKLTNNYNLKNIHYLICGDGPEKLFLKKYVNDMHLKGHVHFLGLRNDISNILQDCDLFINVSKWEGLPLAVIEAFASGIPVLLSPIEEHIAICKNIPQCYLADSLTGISFAKKVIQIKNKMTNMSHAQILENRKPAISQYSMDNFANSYENLFTKLSD
jgi:glycosyltransferase involved in cell wall biosynthesis